MRSRRALVALLVLHVSTARQQLGAIRHRGDWRVSVASGFSRTRRESGVTSFTHIESPVGPLLVAADDVGLRAIEFHPNRHPVARGAGWCEGAHPLIDLAARQLDEYFAGARRTFDLPLAPEGTDFQRTVWLALAEIPYGRTISYSELAVRVGRPSAVRAVGAANGRNPLPIVLPCHRVIGADGSLTGFGGGLPMKRFLLELEGALPRAGLFA